MRFFIWFGIVISGDAFLFDVIKKVLVSVRFREIPVLQTRKAMLVFLMNYVDKYNFKVRSN